MGASSRHHPGMGWYCKGLSVCANVLAAFNLNSRQWFSLGGLMKKLVAVIFFAMFAGNAMAQAGGASTGASGAGAFGSTGSTVGTVALIAVMVAGVVATTNGYSSTNH